MARRLFLGALAICLVTWNVRAAERATFILTDGERISGTLAFHTNTREILIDNDFSLVITPGQPERQFHYAQMAAIDFAGGTPRNEELAALPDNGHLLVMRNGDIRQGHFVNIIGGDTIKWQDQSGGDTQSIPVTSAARIYLNPSAAKTIFNYNGPRRGNQAGNAGNAGNTGNLRNAQIIASNVAVQANTAWNDSGVDVMRGDQLRFDAQGQVTFIQGGTGPTNSGGSFEHRSDKYPVPSLGVGALIGKVGTNGTPFAIGANNNAIAMPASGRLYLGVNDDNVSDNSGSFSVTIARAR